MKRYGVLLLVALAGMSSTSARADDLDSMVNDAINSIAGALNGARNDSGYNDDDDDGRWRDDSDRRNDDGRWYDDRRRQLDEQRRQLDEQQRQLDERRRQLSEEERRLSDGRWR